MSYTHKSILDLSVIVSQVLILSFAVLQAVLDIQHYVFGCCLNYVLKRGQNRKTQRCPDKRKTERFNGANSKFISEPLNPLSRMNEHPTPVISLHFQTICDPV